MNIPFFNNENLSQDSIHGYIAYSSSHKFLPNENVTEQDIILSPWVQRMRQIHQLQTAWIIYPTAEHTRYQHILGAMHLASVVWRHWSDSFYQVFDDRRSRGIHDEVPSPGYIESLLRMAALLHDIGHGPFGHFFDEYFLRSFKTPNGNFLTHETLGAEIIKRKLGPMLRGIRRNPQGQLKENETLSPEQIAFLIVRPQKNDGADHPFWLCLLRTLFSGLYTVDNMDFVLRDAFMSGFNERAFDLERLVHYSFFTEKGLTLHQKGLSTLTRFLNVRAELFRSVYFHRNVKAIDLTLIDLFKSSSEVFYPYGNPLDSLDQYLFFTEWTLFSEVLNWSNSPDSKKNELSAHWKNFLFNQIEWKVISETTLLYQPDERESASIFSDKNSFEQMVRLRLPSDLKDLDLRFDISKHTHRPDLDNPAGRQNFLYDPALEQVSYLESEDIYNAIPKSFRICRVYARNLDHQKEVAEVVEKLNNKGGSDDLTNM